MTDDSGIEIYLDDPQPERGHFWRRLLAKFLVWWKST
jgi:hypothetical protein